MSLFAVESRSQSRLSRPLTLALHLLVWGCLATIPLFLRPPFPVTPPSPPQIYPFLSIPFLAGVFYLHAYFLLPKVLLRRGTGAYLLALLGVYLVNLLYVGLILVLIPDAHTPLRRDLFFFAGTFFPLMLSLGASYIHYSLLQRSRIDAERRELENQRLQSELSFLRSQVSPHFMFNVLNNLVSLARKKSDLLEPSLIRLSHLMRYMLYESVEARTPLEREIEYLQSYVDLQLLRFGEDVAVQLRTRHLARNKYIEPMLLIPFVENAFKHGIGMIDKPRIDISLVTDETGLRFEVRNKVDPQAAPSHDPNSGIGLNNVARRLDLIYPGKHQLNIQSLPDSFYIHLTLPL
ncbi:MAG: histidine kinase [Bacteroidetes bacterium]|nr:MAG: histidine kinase [Bacteroidota bacterium]